MIKITIFKTKNSKIMKVAFISSEVYPFSKTGGMADVSGALPKELKKLGIDIKVFTPKYERFLNSQFDLKPAGEKNQVKFLLNGEEKRAKIFKSTLPNSTVEVFFVENSFYFGREKIYTEDADEGERFIFFQKAVLEFLRQIKWTPDLIHSNDWQTALIPYYVKEQFKATKSTANLLTLHNVAYQGIFPQEVLSLAGVERKLFFPLGPAEYYGKFNFLKMGIYFADKINTVSPTYAKEILQAESGAGLEGILQERAEDIVGILNGVDYEEWNPVFDSYIVQNYDEQTLDLKVENKKALCKKVGLKFEEDVPIVGLISRMVAQKGLDLLTEVMPELLKLNARWVLLGAGEKEYEVKLTDLAENYPTKLVVKIGYDNELAHQIEAGADIFLMPSKYEPCGLNQIYSLKYGTPPIVRFTGGLADTVIPYRREAIHSLLKANGFGFKEYDSGELLKSVRFAVETFQKKDVWRQLQLNGMSKDFSWSNSAKEYKNLYEETIRRRREDET
jgi:starch synthase